MVEEQAPRLRHLRRPPHSDGGEPQLEEHHAHVHHQGGRRAGFGHRHQRRDLQRSAPGGVRVDHTPRQNVGLDHGDGALPALERVVNAAPLLRAGWPVADTTADGWGCGVPSSQFADSIPEALLQPFRGSQHAVHHELEPQVRRIPPSLQVFREHHRHAAKRNASIRLAPPVGAILHLARHRAKRLRQLGLRHQLRHRAEHHGRAVDSGHVIRERVLAHIPIADARCGSHPREPPLGRFLEHELLVRAYAWWIGQLGVGCPTVQPVQDDERRRGRGA
mmetsp:Transcript_22450/g.64526  ORF Transcript_22450/g.64526 Transcript_22450/m.64526 type:complete len:277 (+) Transcript_22450:1192-2022(+)